MKDKNIYFYMAAALATIIPVQGRFAFGLIMLLLFNVQIFGTVLFCHLISFLKLHDLKNVLVSIELVAITIFFKQMLILLCPIAAFTLGFLMYFPALSSAIIEFCYKDNSSALLDDLREKGMRNLIFTVVALLIFLLRDMIGFGTITFPALHKIAVVHLSRGLHTTYASSFIATIPGAFVLVALILALYLFVRGQFDKIDRAGGAQ